MTLKPVAILVQLGYRSVAAQFQKTAMYGAGALKNHDVSAFDLLDWQNFSELTVKGVCVKEAVTEVNTKKAAQKEAQKEAVAEVNKKKAAQKNTTCVVLEENSPHTASTTRAEALVFQTYMTRGYELEAERMAAKKDFEEQVQLQDVKNFEARVKSFLEDK